MSSNISFINSRKSWWPWAPLLIIFSASILIRLPNLIRPLSSHNEDATAHVLVTLMGLKSLPVSEHHYLPVFTVGGPANRFIDDLPTASRQTATGISIYTSFPPLGFIAPYLVSRLLSLEPDLMFIRIFNLGLQAVDLLLLAGLLSYLGATNFSLLMALTCYILTPQVLWSHSNAYWAHSLAQPLFIAATWAAVIFLQDQRRLLTLAVSVFLLCQTEWFGYVFVAGFGILGIWRFILTRDKWTLLGVIVVSGSALLALGFMLLHFSSVLGFAEYFSALTHRYEVRRGDGSLLHQVGQNYLRGFLPTALSALGLMLALITKILLVDTNKANNTEPPKQALLKRLTLDRNFQALSLSLFVLVENILLLNHTAKYDFATLKAALPLMLGISLFVNQFEFTSLKPRIILVCVLIAVSTGNIALYWTVNNPIYGNDQIAHTSREIGETIARETAPDEVAFIDASVRGHLIYYAKRNIVEECADIICAQKFLATSQLKKAKIFHLSSRTESDRAALLSQVKRPWWFILPMYNLYPWTYYGKITSISRFESGWEKDLLIENPI